jgi:hypothetical protein
MGPFCLLAQVEDSFLSWIRVPVSTRVGLFGFLKYEQFSSLNIFGILIFLKFEHLPNQNKFYV